MHILKKHHRYMSKTSSVHIKNIIGTSRSWRSETQCCVAAGAPYWLKTLFMRAGGALLVPHKIEQHRLHSPYSVCGHIQITPTNGVA
jgi:hypothetical protein